MKNLVAGTAVWLATFEFTRDITVPYLGVGFNVLVAVGIGTFCAFAIAKEKIEPRSRMWQIAVACFFMGGLFTAIVQSVVMHLTIMKMTDGLQAGMGATVSFCTRFLLPWLAELIQTGKWIEYIPFLRRKE